MGNLRSVERAFEAAGASASVTADPGDISECDALCVPGQGIFGRCLERLRASGLDRLVREWIDNDGPFFGICLGMQVLFDQSDEGGAQRGLGILEGDVTRLDGDERVPHIGWNTVGGEHYYFDHSYAVRPADESIVKGWCDHGGRFAAWIEKGTLAAVQFHPEKSARAGIAFLRGWIESAIRE